MIFVRKSERSSSSNEQVTGSAQLERIISMQKKEGVQLAMVNFEYGSITHWHSHPGEQILYVIEGDCRFGNEAGERVVAKLGDAIHIPAGEKHWHGAVDGKNMAHLSVTTVGGPNWMEPVASEDSQI